MKVVYALFLSLFMATAQPTNTSVFYTDPQDSKSVVINLDNLKTKSKKVAVGALKTVGFAYNHVGMVFSKNTLATVALLAWPILKHNPELLTEIAQFGTDVIVKINGAIAEGIVTGLLYNTKATTQLIALMTAKQTGMKIASGIAEVIADVFLMKKIFK
jgi:hypothetical protein